MKVKVLDCDYETVMARDCMDGVAAWRKLKERVAREAADRQLRASMERSKALTNEVAAMDTSTMSARATYLRKQDELTRLFAEQDELMNLAFPRSNS